MANARCRVWGRQFLEDDEGLYGPAGGEIVTTERVRDSTLSSSHCKDDGTTERALRRPHTRRWAETDMMFAGPQQKAIADCNRIRRHRLGEPVEQIETHISRTLGRRPRLQDETRSLLSLR